jgi:hypothetical protein
MSFPELYQASLTVIIGVSVYVLGQIIMMFFIDPVNKLKLTIGEVLDILVYYANVYTNPRNTHEPDEMTQRRNEASDALRQKAVQLKSRANLVRLYSLASFFRMVPREEEVNQAHSELIFLSNQCFTCDPVRTFESSEKTQKLLSFRKWNPWKTITSNINIKTLVLYSVFFLLSFVIVVSIYRFLDPFFQVVALRIGPIDLFGFLLPLMISIVLFLEFDRVSGSKRKIALLLLLVVSVYMAFQARVGQPIGIFNTQILSLMTLIDSFVAVSLSNALQYPPSVPSQRALLQSLAGAGVSWISPILAELYVCAEWAQQGVLQEKLNYMVLGGGGLYDALFYWGFLTALLVLIFQILLFLVLRFVGKAHV